MAKPDYLGDTAKGYLDDTGTKIVSEVDIEGPNATLSGTVTANIVTDGSSTMTGGAVSATTVSGSTSISGGTISGTTGTFSSNVTISGDLQVNGGDITSTSGSIRFGNENVSTTGSITATSFSGAGTGLTNIPAAALPLSVSTSTASGGGSLTYSNGVFTFRPAAINASITIGTEGTASGNGAIAWNSGTRTLTYTPPTLAGLGYSEPPPTDASITIGAEPSASGNGAIAWNSGTRTLTYTPPTLAGLGYSGSSTSYGDVGTYVYAVHVGTSGGLPYSINPGSTTAGSNLKPVSVSGSTSTATPPGNSTFLQVNFGSVGGSSLSGTWRCMGYSYGRSYTPYLESTIYLWGIGLWVRIS